MYIPLKQVIDWAELFRQFRASQRLTQVQLAVKLGYSVRMIQMVEQGKRSIPANKQNAVLAAIKKGD